METMGSLSNKIDSFGNNIDGLGNKEVELRERSVDPLGGISRDVKKRELHRRDLFAPETIELGRELFRQSFMAVDYLEMKLVAPFRVRRSTTHVTEAKEQRRSKKRESSERRSRLREYVISDRGDVPGWVLVVLMTTGLVTAIWNTILRNSLDSMNNIR